MYSVNRFLSDSCLRRYRGRSQGLTLAKTLFGLMKGCRLSEVVGITCRDSRRNFLSLQVSKIMSK